MSFDKLGEENKDKYGCKYKIIECNSYSDIVIEFQDEYKSKIHTTYQHFLNNNVKNPYCKNVLGVGITGVLNVTNFGKMELSYIYWRNMLVRGYDKTIHEKYKTYEHCFVLEKWHFYENFRRWFDNNYYELGNEKMCLDKDILFKNNKKYSCETCMFVPSRINCLFTKSNKTRGTLPIGVYFNKKSNKYRAMYSKYDSGKSKNIHIGMFPTPEEAFYAYKHAKESYIKQVADEYKSKYANFPQKLYDAMYSYEVEITD